MAQLGKKYLIEQSDIDTWKQIKHIPGDKFYEAELYKLLDLYIKFVNDRQSRCLTCVDNWRDVRENVAIFFGVHGEWAQQKINEIKDYTDGKAV